MLVVWLFSPKGWVANRIHYVTASFSILLFASWLLSPYMDEPICAGTVEDYFKVLVFYLLVLTTVRDERGLWLLIAMFVAASGLYMAHSFVEFLNGRYEYRMGIRRMIGVDTSFGDPNAFASSLAVHGAVGVVVVDVAPSKRMRQMLAAYLLGVCVCIALTGSRTGFVGLCLCGLLMLLVSVRRKALVFVLGGIGGVAALGLAIVALPAELQNRYLTILDSSYGPKNAAASANSRLDCFLDGCRAWQNSPVIGHGPRSFDFITGHMMGSHNLYGQVLCEMGLLGVLTLAAFVVCFVLNCVKIRRYYLRPGGQAARFSVLSVAQHGHSSRPALGSRLGWPFALPLQLALVRRLSGHRRPLHPQRDNKPQRGRTLPYLVQRRFAESASAGSDVSAKRR